MWLQWTTYIAYSFKCEYLSLNAFLPPHLWDLIRANNILTCQKMCCGAVNHISHFCPVRMWNAPKSFVPYIIKYMNIKSCLFLLVTDVRMRIMSQVYSGCVGSRGFHTVLKVSTHSKHHTCWRCIFRLAALSICQVWLIRLCTVSLNVFVWMLKAGQSARRSMCEDELQGCG